MNSCWVTDNVIRACITNIEKAWAVLFLVVAYILIVFPIGFLREYLKIYQIPCVQYVSIVLNISVS